MDELPDDAKIGILSYLPLRISLYISRHFQAEIIARANDRDYRVDYFQIWAVVSGYIESHECDGYFNRRMYLGGIDGGRFIDEYIHHLHLHKYYKNITVDFMDYGSSITLTIYNKGDAIVAPKEVLQYEYDEIDLINVILPI